MMMAVSIMGLIGLSVGGAAVALSSGYDNGQEQYECLQTGRVTLLRLERLLRSSLLVTDVNRFGIWLWREDTNGDGQINVTEVTMIGWNRGSDVLHEYSVVFPDHWSDFWKSLYDAQMAVDDVKSSNTSFFSTYSQYITDTPLADNVTNFQADSDEDAPMVKMLRISMTTSQGEQEVTLQTAVSLRAGRTDHLAWVDYYDSGYWLLVD